MLLVDFIAIAGRCLLGVVFACSAGGKLLSRQAFRDFAATLPATGLVPAGGQFAAAAALVAAELTVPIALVLDPTAGFALGLALLALFTVVIGLVMAHRRRVPCRCFGAGSRPLGTVHLVRNGLLVGVGGLGLYTSLQPAGAVSSGAIGLAAGVGIVLGALLVTFDEFVDLFVPESAREGVSL